MTLLKDCAWLLFISQVFTYYQNQYILYQENVTIPYVDKTFLDISAEIYPLNGSVNALNATGTLKQDVPEDAKVYLTAYKWLGTDYQLRLLHVGLRLIDALQMDSLGLEELCLKYVKPPLVWPLQKGVTYRSSGWSPDSPKFPPNIPGGRYKINLKFEHPNKTVLVEANWFMKIIYKK